jgi:Arc/MetJ family transcription regulator
VAFLLGGASSVDEYTIIRDTIVLGRQMPARVTVDDGLLQEALLATGIKNSRAVVQAALRLLIEIQGQTAIRRFRGGVTWHGHLSDMREGRMAQEQAP